MNFPKEFKSFEECEKYFSDKSAGIFHGDTYVIIRILTNDDRTEDQCFYAINPRDSSLTKVKEDHKDLTSGSDKSRSSETVIDTTTSNAEDTIQTITVTSEEKPTASPPKKSFKKQQ